MSLKGTRFISTFEAYCPQWLAEPGDPVGLQIGTLNKPLDKVMVTLDVRPEVVEEAIKKKVDLIIAKHPPIFRPVNRLDTDSFQNKMYADLLKHDISVFAAHTNLDIIENGLNDWFCDLLGIQNTSYLTKTHSVPYKKLAVYVPIEEAAAMRKALGKAGAGTLGNYQNTSYSLIGTGRFTPKEAANPTIGEIGKEESVQEAKIEVIFPEPEQEAIVQAMYQAHSYEEPAYEIFTIENYTKDYGLGRIGQLAEPIELAEFITKIKQVFHLDGLRVVTSDFLQKVQTVAICGGSGEKFYPDALAQKADVYITGDLYYHTGHDMLTEGLSVIDPGHYIEELCKPKLVELFNQWKKENNWDLTFIASEVNTNPFQFK